jgi:hypothetical protein
MLKMVIGAAVGAAAVLAASSGYAMGGGPTPPSASPYAILEPQSVNSGWAGSGATLEGRSAFTGEYSPAPTGDAVPRERRLSHRHHHVPAFER